MLSRSTLALTAAALIAGGGYLVYDSVVVPRQETAEAEAKDLFAFEEEDIQQFQLVTEQATFEFVRSPEAAADPAGPDGETEADPADPPAGEGEAGEGEASDGEASDPAAEATPPDLPAAEWQMQQPLPGPANDASIAFLLNLMTTGASSKSFTIAADRAAEFGFDTPYATVTVTLKDGSTHRLILGNPDFDRTSLYAQIDPPEGTSETTELTLRLVPMTFEQAVGRPLDDWQQTVETDTDTIQGLDESPLPAPGQPPVDPTASPEPPTTPEPPATPETP